MMNGQASQPLSLPDSLLHDQAPRSPADTAASHTAALVVLASRLGVATAPVDMGVLEQAP